MSTEFFEEERSFRDGMTAMGLDEDQVADLVDGIRRDPDKYALKSDAQGGALAKAILAARAGAPVVAPATSRDVIPYTPPRAEVPLLEGIRQDASVQALLELVSPERVLYSRASLVLDQAREAMDAKRRGHGNSELAEVVSRVCESLKNVHVPRRGALPQASKRAIVDIIGALGLFPPEPSGDSTDEEDEDHAGRPPSSASDEDDPAAVSFLLTLAPEERAQMPPEHWTDTPQLVADAFRIIMGMPEVRASLRFELVPFLKRVHDNVLAGKAAAAGEARKVLKSSYARMLGGGKCQSRKTPLKVCTFIMCRMMGVATVVITTGTSGRDDLFQKFSAYLRDVDVPHPPITLAEDPFTEWHYERGGNGKELPRLALRPPRAPESVVIRLPDIKGKAYMWGYEQLLKGACIILNNSAAALERVGYLLHHARNEALGRGMGPLQFALVIDEADDFYRTGGSFVEGQESERIQMERALAALRKYGPLLEFEVTATLLAIFVILVAMGKADNLPAGDIVFTDASSEYVGTDSFVPLKLNGGHAFLEAGDLKKSNTFVDAKVKAIWADAASHERSLLLDATTAAVTAAGNTTQKAELLLKLHPHAIAIVVAGSFIKWRTEQPGGRYPNDVRWSVFTGKARIFVSILEDIDQRYPSRPVFVFGYSQLMRGISYRSRLRVPSHLILFYGTAMSMCKLVQAAGRSNGEQRRQLTQAGFAHVKVLTKASDFDTIVNYPAFLEAIKQKMQDGQLSLSDALAARHAGKFNFSGRTVAQRKLNLDLFAANIMGPFDRPLPGDLLGAEAADLQFKRNGTGKARAILEAMIDCQAFDEDSALTSTEVVDELSTCAYDKFWDMPPDGRASLLSTQDVLAVLHEHSIKPPHREALFIKDSSKRRPCFFINEAGLEFFNDEGEPSGEQPSASTALVLQQPGASTALALQQPSASTALVLQQPASAEALAGQSPASVSAAELRRQQVMLNSAVTNYGHARRLDDSLEPETFNGAQHAGAVGPSGLISTPVQSVAVGAGEGEGTSSGKRPRTWAGTDEEPIELDSDSD